MKKVLFVDDEPHVLQALRRMLHNMRDTWDMQFANSAAEALEFMAQDPAFDVVVSDMRMPEMDGAQFLSIVRDHYPETIRMVLSGQTDSETIFRAAGISHQFVLKPCQAEVLKDLVERAFALRDHLGNARLQSLLSRLSTIPSVPDLYQKVMRELQKPDPEFQQIAEIIEQDFGMCAKLLHFVNSAHFGLQHQISNPFQAINYIGLNNLRSLILSVEMFSQVDAKRLPPGFSLGRLWRHSLGVGAISRQIARAESQDVKFIDEAYMAGLLHDAGALVLASNMPELYGSVLSHQRKEHTPLTDSEILLLGASHAEVGAYLLALWGLPDPIVEAVAFHHLPGQSLFRTFAPLSIVHVADCLCAELNPEFGGEDSQLDKPYLMELGLLERLPEWRDLSRAVATDIASSIF